MEIVFSANNRKDILHLPIIPEELEISFPHNNVVIDTATGGQLKIFGEAGLKAISYSSWCPMNNSPNYAKSKVLAPRLKEFFTQWKRKKKPIRIVITYKSGYELHNEEYAIDEFVFGYDRMGDLTYSLSLESLG